MIRRDSKIHNILSSLFLFIIIRSGPLAEVWWSVCISKSQRMLCVSFSRANSGLCKYHLFVWSNLNFWHSCQLITLPNKSCQVLYSFCANLLHSLMWLMVSSLSPHNKYLLFGSYLFLLWCVWCLWRCFALLLE